MFQGHQGQCITERRKYSRSRRERWSPDAALPLLLSRRGRAGREGNSDAAQGHSGHSFNLRRVTHLAYGQVPPVLVGLDSAAHNAEKVSLVLHLAYVVVEVDDS